jgi:hypothetical protein
LVGQVSSTPGFSIQVLKTGNMDTLHNFGRFGRMLVRRDQIAFIGDKHHRPDGLRIDYGRPEEEFKVLSSLKPNQLL